MNSVRNILLAAALGALAASPVLAGEGHGKHGGKHGNKHGQVTKVEKHGGKHGRGHADHYAYVESHRAGGCPPGLAKKNNGCLPPGQAKKLAIGQPLPHGAVYRVPQPVLATLPPPPPGYRYAVVNNQVVLVSGSDIIVDILRSVLG